MIVSPSQILLSGFQLELNQTLVAKTSLHPAALADEMLTAVASERIRYLEKEEAVWGIPGPMHRLALRSIHGFDSLADAERVLGTSLQEVQSLAASMDARIVGLGMHPWMQAGDGVIWPHGKADRENAILELFGDSRHGFYNQQGLGLSLPFETEAEFERLFAALRFALPLFTAFAAGSPFADGEIGPAKQCRLAARRDFFESEIAFAAQIVPRFYSCRAAVQAELGRPLEEALQELGISGTLRAGDVCGDGMIADFHSGLIHLQVLDMQECLSGNLAVVALVTAIAQELLWEVDIPFGKQSGWNTTRLNELLELSLLDAEDGVLRDVEYLESFGFPQRGACRVSELLQFLIEEKLAENDAVKACMPTLQGLVREGSLATRCIKALPPRWTEEDLYNLYKRLADCQQEDERF